MDQARSHWYLLVLALVSNNIALAGNSSVPTNPHVAVDAEVIEADEYNDVHSTIFTELSNIGRANIITDGVGNDELQTNAVTSAKISDGTIASADILDTTIANDDIANGTIAWGKLVSTVLPAGTVVDYAGTSAPSGWLFCYGQAISRTTYADLFTAIGTTYGTGDGSTTFNLPDMRGRVTAGEDDMGGSSANRLTASPTGSINGDTSNAAGGTEGHTLTTAEIPSHTHDVPFAAPAAGATAIAGSGNAATATVASNATGGGGAHNNVQPTIIVRKMICTGGI